MDKSETRRLKALLTIGEADIRAAKTMVRNPDALSPARLRCQITHWLESGAAILELLDGEEVDTRQVTLDLDHIPA